MVPMFTEKGWKKMLKVSFQKDFGGQQGLDNLVQLRMTITLEQYASESKDCVWIVLQPGIFFLYPSIVAVSMNSV